MRLSDSNASPTFQNATTSVAGKVQLEALKGTTAGLVVTGDDTRLKRRVGFVLCAGFTPGGTGADGAEYVVPYGTDGDSITWTLDRATMNFSTAGGAPVAKIQKSTAALTSVFGSGTDLCTLTTAVSGDSGVTTTTFAVATVVSGNRIRFNVTTLGTATGWSISMTGQES